MLGFFGKILVALLLTLPVVSACRLIFRKQSKVRKWFLWSLISAVGCYLLLMLSVTATEIHLEKNLAAYDLDGDGNLADEEATPELKKALDDVTQDTGRSLAPFTGLVTCPIYSGFWHLLIGTPFILLSMRTREREVEPVGTGQPM